MSDPISTRSQRATIISAALARLVVPAWIMTGAVVKLVHGTATNLPGSLLDFGTWLDRTAGINLHAYLGFFIAVEFIAVAGMLFVPRLARFLAVSMLAVFCLVLVGELVRGNFTSCGCFGTIPVPPWAMLLVDGALLVALLVLPGAKTPNAAWSLPAAGVAGLVGVAATVLVLRAETAAPPIDPPVVSTPGGAWPVTPPAGPPFTARGAMPGYFVPEFDTWSGSRFLETPFAQLLHWPEDIEDGRRYVILYSPSCDHCQHLINEHIKDAPPVPTIALALPTSDPALPMQLGGCAKADLPKCDWVLTPPVVIAIEDGVVRCAGEEGDDPQCLLWR